MDFIWITPAQLPRVYITLRPPSIQQIFKILEPFSAWYFVPRESIDFSSQAIPQNPPNIAPILLAFASFISSTFFSLTSSFSHLTIFLYALLAFLGPQELSDLLKWQKNVLFLAHFHSFFRIWNFQSNRKKIKNRFCEEREDRSLRRPDSL